MDEYTDSEGSTLASTLAKILTVLFAFVAAAICVGCVCGSIVVIHATIKSLAIH